MIIIIGIIIIIIIIIIMYMNEAKCRMYISIYYIAILNAKL